MLTEETVLKPSEVTVQNTIDKRKIRQKTGKAEWFHKSLILLMLLGLIIGIVLPLIQLFLEALKDKNGEYVGFVNFVNYFKTESLVQSMYNTLYISILTGVISVVLAFFYAYALARTQIRWKGLFKYVAFLPLFAPTMMHGIALIYLFGNKGAITTGFFGLFEKIFGSTMGIDIHLYGPVGIVISEVIYTFPQAFLILMVAISVTDYRLYEAAETLGSGKMKKFFTVTIPSIKYGLVSAFFVAFILSFTDFGAPKVVGAQYNVLATDIYKQVVGQQNLSMGSTVGIILIIPALVAFFADRMMQRKQSTSFSSKSVSYKIVKNPWRDKAYFVYCLLISLGVLSLIGAIIAASLVKVWPYNFSLTLEHLTFKNVAGNGLEPYFNSLYVSFITAILGTIIIFFGAYLIEKTRFMKITRQLSYFLSILPLALPGLVIGLAYIFFFNKPVFEVPFIGVYITNPFQSLYGTFMIIILANIIHFYSVNLITATTALKKLDKEFEPVSESMNIPFYKTFCNVTVPMSLPAILEIGIYLFVNSMTTISAVIFLYTADTKLASISIVNMTDAGDTAPAAAMSLIIVLTNILVRVVYEFATKKIRNRAQAWQQR
ncbi:putative 2-aminoethylphosphonate ABC transporter permease subunit [Paenibacillus sp. BSR1-1]|uniref:putative 2-aminoethylphosphonate ABC transporter permease subunit n=1 Tax=Paenibacillus sp. BSR1-1 TaxID=3020845 RepID=UPI0025AFB7EB|nr:putative 2-aminoethylphosphonate ABC transporter permease subunit [Paenibacillus sp. BSR1-1]MDN3016923.1 putative 2-aminoethylphosphonate ABC transporter permease subunit [Paenibacillus sp. BSR1-1]